MNESDPEDEDQGSQIMSDQEFSINPNTYEEIQDSII